MNLECDEIKNRNKEVILSVALSINKELFDEKEISYKLFKYTEESIMKEFQKYNSLK